MIINNNEYRVHSIAPSVQLQYKLTEKDDGTFVVVDRGTASDIYESTFTILGKTSIVEELHSSIRRYGAHLTIFIQNNSENLFGDNFVVGYTGVDCTIMQYGEVRQRLISTSELTLTVRANNSNLIIRGSSLLPSMKCILTGYWTKTTLGTTTKDTYNGMMSYADSLKDIHETELSTVLSLEDAISLQNWFRQQRGGMFVMEESVWGVDKPFRDVNNAGLKPDIAGYPYNARMMSLSIEPFGVSHRRCTMLLRKEGR